MERHAGELALAEANLRAIQALDAIPNGVRTILRGHMETAIRRLRAARRERFMLDTVQVTVGFVDLVGYARLSQQLDPRALGTLVERFEALASDTVAARDGRVVKLIGDEVMFVAVDAAAACDIALTLVERFAGDPSVTPRGGLALGPALMRSGDYYGPVVNLASRIADLAVPGEILVTAEVVDQVGTDRFRFEPAGGRSRASTTPFRSTPLDGRDAHRATSAIARSASICWRPQMTVVTPASRHAPRRSRMRSLGAGA